MAVQFPNFLGAQLVRPDFSGLGDAVSNYYGGKMLPKDDLIKAVQAEFARPTAEQALLSSKLSNQRTRQEIAKTAYEMAQQQELERQLKQAMMGGGKMPSNSIPMMPTGNQLSSNQASPILRSQINNPSLQNALSTNALSTDQSVMSGQANQLPPVQSAQSQMQPQQSTEQAMTPQMPQENVITKGSPHLAGVDLMWDNSPLARAFLEKKGYKKSQQIKFDNKTGRTSIITTYPSGKITVQSTGADVGGEGIPLTNKMISKHQNIVSSVDVAVPVLKELADMGSYPRQSIYRGGQYADYEGKVSQAIDSVLGAFGLPMTNEGIDTIRHQVEIKTFETPSHYKKRMEKLIADLEKRKNYSAEQVKRSNKIQPVGRMGNEEPDLSNMSNEELQGIAYGS